jgi:hypothetical protein
MVAEIEYCGLTPAGEPERAGLAPFPAARA